MDGDGATDSTAHMYSNMADFLGMTSKPRLLQWVYIIMLEMSSIDIILRFFHEKQLDAYAFDCWLLFRRFGVWWAEVYSY